jgi:hypothetical protein
MRGFKTDVTEFDYKGVTIKSSMRKKASGVTSKISCETSTRRRVRN